MEPWAAAVVLFLVGGLAGALNVVAGGGSFLTLPVLIFLGVPPGAANQTNRLGILTQNIGAVWGFHRRRVLEWRFLWLAAAPSAAGALLGAAGALRITDTAFQRLLAILMVTITLWTLWDPLKRLGRRADGGRLPSVPVASRDPRGGSSRPASAFCSWPPPPWRAWTWCGATP